MKLYVWSDPYDVVYGSSLLFVVAESVEAAKEIARVGTAWKYGKYRNTTPGVVLGDPTRVLELPCAEWHHWEE